MPLQGLTIAVTTGPTEIAASGHGLIRVTLTNRGGGSVYLGGSDVTTAGYALTTDAPPLGLTLLPYDALYGASTGSITINVLRSGETS